MFFWLTVKTVTVNIIKTFNTEGREHHQQQYSETGVNPFKNNLEGFVIKKFRGNQLAEERNPLITTEFRMMGPQASRQREFDV